MKKDLKLFHFYNLCSEKNFGYLFYAYSSNYNVVTDIALIGHVSCKAELVCNISTVYVVYHSANSKYLLTFEKITLNSLSLNFLLILEKARVSVLALGKLKVTAFKQFGLASQIMYFMANENQALKSSLGRFHQINSKYVDKIQMLAFAYASIYTNFVGNLTKDLPKDIKGFDIEKLEAHFPWDCFIDDTENILRMHHDLSIQNNFAKLKFVSCGLRGLEPFPFLEFVSVFGNFVWISMLTAFID